MTALERTQTAPGGDKRLLEGIFRVMKRAKHAVAVQVQLASIAIDELAKGRLVSRLGTLNQV